MRWPWAHWIDRARDVVRTLEIVNENVVGTRLEVQRALAPRPEPAPWVCVLVQAKSEHGPITRGGTGRAATGKGGIELDTNITLTDVTVIVFVDLERVNVHGIFLGPNLMTAALGSCPVVRFTKWEIGIKLRVQCLPVEGKGYF
jgi:hypothetical protein